MGVRWRVFALAAILLTITFTVIVVSPPSGGSSAPGDRRHRPSASLTAASAEEVITFQRPDGGVVQLTGQPGTVGAIVERLPFIPKGEHHFRETADCVLEFFLENRSRELVGDVNVECACLYSTSCFGSDDCHNCGLGNYGVETEVSGIVDASQWEGWIATSEHSGEWNSCTDTCSSGSQCFNDGDGRQVSNSVQGYGAEWETTVTVDAELGCGEIFNEPFSKAGHFLKVFELDGIAHDLITHLKYNNPRPNVVITCDDQESCNTFDPGPWIDPSDEGNGVAWGQVRATLRSVICEGCQ